MTFICASSSVLPSAPLFLIHFISLIHIVMNRWYTHRMRLLFLYMTILQRILLVRRLFLISNSNSFYFIINIIAVIRCFFMRYCGVQKCVFFISLMNYFSWKCYFSRCSDFYNASKSWKAKSTFYFPKDKLGVLDLNTRYRIFFR